ncbi:MAG: NTP transferase domain-containing protein [Ferruginibacter sp.]
MKSDDLILKNTVPVRNLFGLVICGGNSKRMGSDKSLLVYYKKPQRYHLYDMLRPVCEKVFISCNASQSSDIPAEYEPLVDISSCFNIGPMAAIVTACIHYPENDFLVIGCDYPFLAEDELYSFVSSNEQNIPAAFYNDLEDLYEPLLGYYPGNCNHELMKMYATGQYSLQHFLKNESASKYHPVNKKSIRSIDTRYDYVKAKKSIDLNPDWK